MGWASELADVLQKYSSATPTGGERGQSSDTHQDFDRIAQTAPRSAVADGLTEAFRSNQTPPFAEMIAHLFSQSSSDQQAGILNRLLTAVGPEFVRQAGMSGILTKLAGMAAMKQPVTPEVAKQVPTEAVKQVAARAEQTNPSIVQMAGEFYAQHPALVKTLGAAALSIAMSQMARRAA